MFRCHRVVSGDGGDGFGVWESTPAGEGSHAGAWRCVWGGASVACAVGILCLGMGMCVCLLHVLCVRTWVWCGCEEVGSEGFRLSGRGSRACVCRVS